MPELSEELPKAPSLTPEQEEAAYRSSSGVTAPITGGELGMTAAQSIAMPYALGHAMRAGKRWLGQGERKRLAKNLSTTGLTPGAMNRLREQYEARGYSPDRIVSEIKQQVDPKAVKPARARAIVDRAWRMNNPKPTLAGTAANFLAPSLPGVALSGLWSLTQPLSDPKYQRGDRGYLNSWWQGQKNNADELGDKARETRERYGALGIPLQALHGLLNPIPSLIYGGGAVKNYFAGEKGTERVEKAAAAVRLALKLFDTHN